MDLVAEAKARLADPDPDRLARFNWVAQDTESGLALQWNHKRQAIQLGGNIKTGEEGIYFTRNDWIELYDVVAEIFAANDPCTLYPDGVAEDNEGDDEDD